MFGEGREVCPLGICHDLSPCARRDGRALRGRVAPLLRYAYMCSDNYLGLQRRPSRPPLVTQPGTRGALPNHLWASATLAMPTKTTRVCSCEIAVKEGLSL